MVAAVSAAVVVARIAPLVIAGVKAAAAVHVAAAAEAAQASNSLLRS